MCTAEHYALCAKLHYTDTANTTTDKLTTILQLVVQYMPHRNARAQHLDMSRCWDVANFLAVGGEFVVQQVVELL